MNERIDKLMVKAGAYFGAEGVVYADFDPKKFAELIVGECMTTVLKESKWYWDKDEFESANAIQNAARRVKEHFGVEE